MSRFLRNTKIERKLEPALHPGWLNTKENYMLVTVGRCQSLTFAILVDRPTQLICIWISIC